MIPYEALLSRARAALSPEAHAYYAAGSGDEQTVAEAEEAWRRIHLRPRVLRDVGTVDPSTTLLGQKIAAPVAIAPTAAHGLAHPDGEVATAAGAAKAGSLYVLSTRSTARLEDVVGAAGTWWMQIYVMADRGLSDELARRAADAGAGAIVLTVDTPAVAAKHKASAALRFPGPGLLPELGTAPVEALEQAPDVTERDLQRLAEITGLPVVAKGVLREDDAQACTDAGAAAIVVSTHGGRQLDGVVPTAWALPEVVEAVGDRVEVYVDGGVRTGRDVLRALALGARAAWFGRPVLWALAAGGADGVADLLDGLRLSVAEALLLAGCPSPTHAGRDLVWSGQTPPHTVKG
jgi:4-hydroxymandelate oxidase